MTHLTGKATLNPKMSLCLPDLPHDKFMSLISNPGRAAGQTGDIEIRSGANISVRGWSQTALKWLLENGCAKVPKATGR